MKLDFFIELKRRHVYRVAVAYGVVGWLLIEFSTQVFPVLHMPEWTQQLVVMAILFGFPLTLVLAWAFELTPDGVRRTEPSHSPDARSHEDHRHVGRTLDFTIIGVLVLALAVALWRPWLHPGAMGAAPAKGGSVAGETTSNPSLRNSIAVLPFTNNSNVPDQRYFSDGLSESLIIALNQYPELTVISRKSSFNLPNPDLDSKQIGKQLGVAYLLEGSVSRVGKQVRISAELVEAAHGRTVWSRTYDRPYENLFRLQDSITAAVAKELRVKLLHPSKEGAVAQTDRPRSGNLDAYNALLQGHYYFNHESLQKAIDAYQRAIDADPRYAVAYAWLSMVWSHMVGSTDIGPERKRVHEKARRAADTAIALDDRLSIAYAARGYASETMLAMKDAMSDFQRAYRLEPSNPLVIRNMATVSAAYGDTDAAVRLIHEAIRRNPLHGYSHMLNFIFLTYLGKYDAAQDALERARSLRPTNPLYAYFAQLQLLRGHADKAAGMGKSIADEFSRNTILALALPAVGDKEGGERALHWLINQHADIAAYQVAQVYAYRGDADQTFYWLERAWHQRDSGLSQLLYDPLFKSYYGDPRFADICHKLGVPVPAAPS